MNLIYNADDVKSLALVAWKEARGEGLEGCRAVMHVIRNRVGQAGFARTLHDCIYGKNQFTSMSVPSDPEFNLEAGDGDLIHAKCMTLAEKVLSSTDPDNTCGAHYYANLAHVSSGWFAVHIVGNTTNHPVVAVIGRHTFFK
jgi:spore germination cell wall hydrolase CwlJ-like protein